MDLWTSCIGKFLQAKAGARVCPLDPLFPLSILKHHPIMPLPSLRSTSGRCTARCMGARTCARWLWRPSRRTSGCTTRSRQRWWQPISTSAKKARRLDVGEVGGGSLQCERIQGSGGNNACPPFQQGPLVIYITIGTSGLFLCPNVSHARSAKPLHCILL